MSWEQDESMLEYLQRGLEFQRIRARLEREYRAELDRLSDELRGQCKLVAEYAEALEQIAGRPMHALQAHNIARRALGLPERVVEDAPLLMPCKMVGIEELKEQYPAPPTAAYERERDVSSDDEIALAYLAAMPLEHGPGEG